MPHSRAAHDDGAVMPARPDVIPEDWPIFHLAHPGPGWAWPADPNFAFFWQGRYHLHYIYDRGGDRALEPFARFYSDERDYAMAHVSSTDLVHWEWHPTTLTKDAVGHEPFSGTGFLTLEGRPAIIYHGGGTSTNHVRIATDDTLENWGDPIPAVIHVRPDQDGSVIAHNDPDAWLEGDTYYAIFGGHEYNASSTTYFRSTDLQNWQYLGPFLGSDLPDAEADTDLSCPQFFPIGDKYMLLGISHNKGCRYYLGRWEEERFIPEFHGRMNWNATDYFAPESLLTADGRRVMWAWAYLDSPQSGIQTLPRELELPADGVLRLRPLRELEVLRGEEVHCPGIAVPSHGSVRMSGIFGAALELDISLRRGSARRFGVRVHCGADGLGGEEVTIDIAAGTFSIGAVVAPFRAGLDDELRLRVFVDKYLIEAFADDRQAVFAAHFAAPEDMWVAVFSEDESIVADVRGWELRSIW